MGQTILAFLLWAGMSGSPAVSIDYDRLENKAAQTNKFTAETVNETIPIENIQLAAIDYCYAGSILDPTTGETVDLFVLCAEDGPEQTIDLA